MSGDNINLYLHQNYLDFFNDIDDVVCILYRVSQTTCISNYVFAAFRKRH